MKHESIDDTLKTIDLFLVEGDSPPELVVTDLTPKRAADEGDKEMSSFDHRSVKMTSKPSTRSFVSHNTMTFDQLNFEQNVFKSALSARFVSIEHKFVEEREFELYYRVPKRIVSYISGCKGHLGEYDINYNTKSDCLTFRKIGEELDNPDDWLSIDIPM